MRDVDLLGWEQTEWEIFESNPRSREGGAQSMGRCCARQHHLMDNMLIINPWT